MNHHDEPEQVQPTSEELLMNRRSVMKAMALVFTGSAAYSLMPNFAYAQGSSELETLADVCYALFPHKTVPRKFYLACAQGLLDKAAGDEALAETLGTGMMRLDRIYSRPFSELDMNEQNLALQRVRPTPFFDSVRGHTVVGLYNIPEVWDYFGYQGSSYEKGGYLNRGFDDVYWLDDLAEPEGEIS